MTKTLCGAVVVGLLGSSSAWAGVVLKMKSEGKVNTLSLEGAKLRAERTGDANWMVFDGDAQTMWVVKPEDREYMELTKEAMQATMGAAQKKMSEAMGKLSPEQRQQMEAMMAKMNPAQRQQMEAMMGKGGAAKAKPSEPAKVSYVATGEKHKVAGYDCQVHQVKENGKLVGEGCFIPFEKTSLGAQDFLAMQKLGEFVRSLLANIPSPPGAYLPHGYQDMKEGPGLPATYARVDEKGQKHDQTELVSLKKDKVPQAQFTMPRGYQKRVLGEATHAD